MNIHCEFFNPVFEGSEEDWEFKDATCDFDAFTLIQNSETGSEFYIDKTMNYGEILIIFLILLVLIFGITKSIAKFVFKRYV